MGDVSGMKRMHYIILKGSVLQEDTTIFNVYAFNKASKHMRQKPDRTARKNRYSYYYN